MNWTPLVDGSWASWASWGTCTVTCGGGIQTRSRTCSSPAPQYGGADCPDFSTSSQTCNTHNCPSKLILLTSAVLNQTWVFFHKYKIYLVITFSVDGAWVTWTSWGTCTVTCGGGTQTRSRTCTNPAPQYGGANCPGSAGSSQACNTQHCPSTSRILIECFTSYGDYFSYIDTRTIAREGLY